MPNSWAYIYGQPGADPAVDRFVIERDGQRTTLVPVPDESAAADVALGLIVVEAVGGRVPIGHVNFGLESVEGAAAYKKRFEARTS